MLQCTDKSKLIRLLEMLGKEAELEQGLVPSEETGCVYEGSMDEDATLDEDARSTALGTVVDISHRFNDLLLSMTRDCPCL